jgi:DNA-binding winged helix-turn-helix (wHTH) protein
MIFSFRNFEFDCDLQILTQDGEVITLNEKPARLLTLFLLNADKIHNKSEILEIVWPGRVVTDQVVFQNISYLRMLFGSDAIKTFTRKGYRWQIALISIESNVIETTKMTIDGTVKSSLSQKKNVSFDNVNVGEKKDYGLMMLLLSIFLIFSAFFLYDPIFNSDQHQDKPLLIALTSDIADFTSKNEQLKVELQPDEFKSQVLFDSPFRTWSAVTDNSEAWVLATRSYDIEQGEVLRFQLQGQNRGWHGYIFSLNQAETYKQLNNLLTILSGSQYFSVQSDHDALSQLTLVHNANPQNFLIAHQLVKLHIELNYLDRATALVNTLLESEETPLKLGIFNLLKAKITMNNDNWQSAQTSIEAAIKTFDALELPQLQSLANIASAWVWYSNKNVKRSIQSLDLAAHQARLAGEPLQEVQAHLLQSFLAGKTNQQALMHTQQDLAQQLIKLHKLDDVHQVPFIYNFAWYAQSREERLLHYSSILTFPYTPYYRNEFYTAAESVRNINIIKKQWIKAIASIKPWQRDSFVLLTRAHVAFAKQEWLVGIDTAIKAFRSAQLNYILEDALDAALLLLQHQAQGSRGGNPSEYISYIEQNANHRWLRQNKSALEKVK